jgi:hypothetical protein
MNEWYIDNTHDIDIFFNTIYNFITYNNITIIIPIETLYNKFVNVSYRGSFIPFKKNSFKKYKVKKKWYNEYYDITLGGELFNLIHDVRIYVQEYNKDFLDNICTHSIQNFFEQYIHDKYNENNDIDSVNNDIYEE